MFSEGGFESPFYFNSLSGYLIRPASIITEALHAISDIKIPSDLYRFAIVESFQFGQFLSISFYQVSKLVDQLGSLKSIAVFPPDCVESMARSSDGAINILWRG